MTNAERMRRYRVKHGLLKTPPGMTQAGWLVDDGIIDMTAVDLVVKGERLPALTHNEAMMAVKLIVQQIAVRAPASSAGCMGANALIQHRFGVDKARAKAMMTTMFRKKKEGVI